VATLTLNVPVSKADRAAAANYDANLAALARNQPTLADAVRAVSPDLQWVYGRDGYLTAFETCERWLTGCSVPLLAARSMLRSLEAGSGVSCFLNPSHAAQVRVALDRHGEHHALICVTPEVENLSALLRCDDFAGDISRGRLWFAFGQNWSEELEHLLEAHPGLPTPTRFIRMPNADAQTVDGMVKDAQAIFSHENARRSDAIRVLRGNWIAPQSQKLCVVARSAFRLWDDAGHTLWTTIAGETTHRFDPDDAAHCSPLALAALASECSAVVTADIFRADAPTVTSVQQPWITWVTTPRIPSVQSAGPHDRLLLADDNWNRLAEQAGWPVERLSIAAWPAVCGDAPPPAGPIALITDTCSLDAPDCLAELSSHLLLWERMRELLGKNPSTLGTDLQAWLNRQAKKDGIDSNQLDVPLFIHRLLIPAYQQSIARSLLSSGLPLQIYGKGWSELPAFAPHACGPVESREQLLMIAAGASALVRAWPAGDAHPIESLGRPVIREVKDLNRSSAPKLGSPATPLSADLILSKLT
jgi:hypothetical protein